MNKKDLFRGIGLIDDDLIEEAENINIKRNHNKMWMKIVSLAACLVFVVTSVSRVLNNREDDFQLKLSEGNVNVSYTDDAPSINQSSDLMYLTEEELFTKYNTEIFKGTIIEIKNIEMNFNGQINYNAIAKIKVSKVYRGDCKENEVISVLLPCSIKKEGVWVEDTETVSAMREGMTGIFMPKKYDKSDYHEENGATLYLKEIASYGFLDGERFAFLDTEDGLVFSKWAYESIYNAKSLDEIESYIKTMIK